MIADETDLYGRNQRKLPTIHMASKLTSERTKKTLGGPNDEENSAVRLETGSQKDKPYASLTPQSWLLSRRG